MATTRTPEVATPTKNQRAISKFVNELGVLDQKGYAGVLGGDGLASQVAEIFRKLGDGVTAWIPGVGLVNGLQAGNYLDSAGTTAATVGNPVGLVLDANGSVGSELVTNGTNPVNTTGWSALFGLSALTATSGEFLATTTVSGQAAGYGVTTVVGKTYIFNATVRAGTCQNVDILLNGGVSTTSTASKTNVDLTVKFVASNTLSVIAVRGTGTVGTFYFNNVSVKEVTGIHATQATTANKPILRRGAVNLLTYSEQFDNAAWVKGNATVTANQTTAPDGTLTADYLLDNAVNGGHNIYQTLTVVSGNTITISVHAKKVDLDYIAIGTVGAGTGYTYFNVATGAIGTVLAAHTASILSLGNGWYRCSITATTTVTSLQTYIGIAAANGGVNYVGSGSKNAIWGAQLETGSTASTYIPTTTAAASSSTGNYHWVHDSTDVLTATFPAGYESATTINASTAGQTTLTAQNIVGAYNIGPSIDTYGRFIFRTGLTASELAIMQTFANRLAGV